MSKESLEQSDSNRSQGSNSKFVVMSDQAIVSATNFLTTIIVGNACGADQLGVYAVGFSIVLLAMAIESSLVSTPFTVLSQSANEKNPERRLGGSLTNLGLVCLVVLAIQLVAWVVARPFLSAGYDQIFQTVLIATPFFAARSYARKVLLATFNAKALLILDLVACTFQLLALWQLASNEFLTPPFAIGVAALCNLIGFGVFLLTQRHQIAFEKSSSKKQIVENWNFGKWLVGEQTLTIISIYGSPWLLVLLLNSETAGVFAACCSITGLVNPFMIGLGNYLLPKFSSEFANQKYSQKSYWYYMSLTLLVVGVFALTCAIFPDRLLGFFYPDDSYSGFGLILAIMSVRTLLGSLGLIAHYALVAMHRQRVSLYASIVCIVVFFVSSLILIPWLGIVGGAIAWSLSAVFESMFMIISFQLLMKTGRRPNSETVALSQG